MLNENYQKYWFRLLKIWEISESNQKTASIQDRQFFLPSFISMVLYTSKIELASSSLFTIQTKVCLHFLNVTLLNDKGTTNSYYQKQSTFVMITAEHTKKLGTVPGIEFLQIYLMHCDSVFKFAPNTACYMVLSVVTSFFGDQFASVKQQNTLQLFGISQKCFKIFFES